MKGLTASLCLALAALAVHARPAALMVEDFEGAPKGAWSLEHDDNKLGTVLKPDPFAAEADGAAGSKLGAHLHGHLGVNQAPWVWAQLRVYPQADRSPGDLSRYKTLRFWAKGDGNAHKVRLIKDSIKDSDHFAFRFNTSSEWKEVRIPLEAFRQAGWGKPVERSFNDVTAIEFSPGAPDADFDFRFDQVELLEEETVLKPIEYDTHDWFEAEGLDLAARRGSALDASASLDKPAGKYGWVRPKGERFVFAKTGKPVRFFGINIVAGANFPSHEQAESMAELLAQMGVNMTRHHHADAPWATHNFFGKGASTRQLDADSLDRFDYLVYQLQKRGIYQYFDMLVHRQPLAADGIKDPSAMINGFKMEGEFAPDAVALEKEFIRQFLGHKNPYTGKKYGEDPAVAGMEIINEDSLFYRQEQGDFAIDGAYALAFQKLFNGWLTQQFGSRGALAKRWAAEKVDEGGLGDDEDPGTNSVRTVMNWGPGKDWEKLSKARALDSYRFTYDLQGRYYTQMSRLIRDLGYQGPLTGSNHWVGEPADLYLNARLDYVDRHAYWSHPQGGYGYDPKISWDASPMIKNQGLGIVNELAQRRVKGKPYLISEWQSCAPNDHRTDAVLAMGAACSLQGWSALQFSLSHTDAADLEHFTGPLDSNTDLRTQPAQLALWGSVSRMLAQQDLPELKEEAYQPISAAEALDPHSAYKVGGPLGLVARTGVDFSRSGSFDAAKAAAPHLKDGWTVSAGGALRHNPSLGLLLIDTPRTQAVAGFAQGHAQALSQLSVDLSSPYGVVVASSLDGKPLQQSFRVLVTAAANAVNEGMALAPAGNQLARVGGPRVLIEPVSGKLTLKVSGQRRGKVWALDLSGRRRQSVPASFSDGGVSFEMGPASRTLYYELALDESSAP